MNVAMRIGFDGSNYHGFQYQENAVTISGKINEALFKATGEKINVVGCSRTDAGVHAKEYYLNFKTESKIPGDKFKFAVNPFLPDDIYIYESFMVPDDFSARFSAKKKQYAYKFYSSADRDPFNYKYAYHTNYKLDAVELDKEAKDFIGRYEFDSFMASGGEVKTTEREIYDAQVVNEDGYVVFRVIGNGFLYNMVRIMAGTLYNISQNKIEKGKIKSIIESKDRKNAGMTMSPCGLYLEKVFYGE